MIERIQGEYPFKAEKIALIKKLTDPKERECAFGRLCEIFSKSWELSRTQGQNLVQSLQDGGFINYTNEFFDRDANFEEVDGAWWDIEHNADVQISAMRIANHLLATSSVEQEAELAVSLLNAGHVLGSRACTWSRDTMKHGRDAQKVFHETEDRALRMIREGIPAGKIFAIDYDDLCSDEFRSDPRFDYWLVSATEPGILNSDAKDLLSLYKKAQNIIYLGYGMAMRDAPVVEQKLWDEIKSRGGENFT